MFDEIRGEDVEWREVPMPPSVQYTSSHSYHLLISVGMEDVGSQLTVVTDVLLDLLKLLLLEGKGCMLSG